MRPRRWSVAAVLAHEYPGPLTKTTLATPPTAWNRDYSADDDARAAAD